MKSISKVYCLLFQVIVTGCQSSANLSQLAKQHENVTASQDMLTDIQKLAPASTTIKTKTKGDCDQTLTNYELSSAESVSIVSILCGDYGAQFHAFYVQQKQVVTYQRKQHLVNLAANGESLHIHREDIMSQNTQFTHRYRQKNVPAERAYVYPIMLTGEFVEPNTISSDTVKELGKEIGKHSDSSERMTMMYQQLVQEF